MSHTDLELLARYARHHAEDAFAELVRRHLGLVYSAALRQVRSPQLAEEVAQSAFTDLARHAARLKPGTILPAWLYQVARRTAIDVIRREASRQCRERTASEMNAMNAANDDWARLEPLLDEAMQTLDEPDRAAVLLRYFENKSLREVGDALGASDNAAQKRLARAVERLREHFAKQGITVGASGLVAVVSANAIQAVPAGLAAAISSSAMLAGAAFTASTATVAKTTAMTAITMIQKPITAGLLALLFGAALYSQHRANRSLRLENSRLNDLVSATARGETPPPGLSEEQLREIERLRAEHIELMRLRGEVTLLRRQATESAGNKPGVKAAPKAEPVSEEPTDSLPRFSARAVGNVPAGHTLVLAGWETSPGKRLLIFVTPKVEASNNGAGSDQVSLHGRFIEVPEAELSRLADELKLDALVRIKTSTRASSEQGVLTPDVAESLFSEFEKSEGVKVLSAPRVLTNDGIGANFSVQQDVIIGGKRYQTGPLLAIEPRIGVDRSSVDMIVTAEVIQGGNLPGNPQ